MKQIGAVPFLLLGICFVVAYYAIPVASYTSWTDEQSQAYAKAQLHLKDVTGPKGIGISSDISKNTKPSKNPKVVVTKSKSEAEDAIAKMQEIQGQLDAAKANGVRKGRLIYWSGVLLIVVGAGLGMAGQKQAA